MKIKHAGWAVALATVLAAPAFAQSAVTSSSGTAVTSGTGVVVTPGVPQPAAVAVVPAHPTLPGAVVAQAGTSTTTSGNTTTTVTRYWVNVPADVERDARFQRWQRLR